MKNRNDDEPDESRYCLECGADLDMRCLQVLGVAFVRYNCPVHGVTAFTEFLT